MAYNEKLLRTASEKIAKRRSDAEADAAKRHSRVVVKCPEIAQLEDKMRKSACGLVKVIGMGDRTVEYIDNLRKENLEAQAEIKKILVSMGYGENYFEPDYFCKKCSDSGFSEGKLCTCHIELLRQLSYEQLCKSSPLKISTFDEFSLDYYKHDAEILELMSCNFEFCRNYAENFDMNSYSLLMTGETGLGKTHLSLAIAGEVINKGYGVIYGSVQNLFSTIEKEHFGRADEADGTTENMLLDCDLLILDDLGAEFTTNFTTATLNNIVNTRILESKPTIISTNLSVGKLDDRYSRRIASRIIGEYQILSFEGKDIRQQKSEE